VHLLVCYLNKLQNARCKDKDFYNYLEIWFGIGSTYIQRQETEQLLVCHNIIYVPNKIAVFHASDSGRHTVGKQMAVLVLRG